MIDDENGQNKNEERACAKRDKWEVDGLE